MHHQPASAGMELSMDLCELNAQTVVQKGGNSSPAEPGGWFLHNLQELLHANLVDVLTNRCSSRRWVWAWALCHHWPNPVPQFPCKVSECSQGWILLDSGLPTTSANVGSALEEAWLRGGRCLSTSHQILERLRSKIIFWVPKWEWNLFSPALPHFSQSYKSSGCAIGNIPEPFICHKEENPLEKKRSKQFPLAPFLMSFPGILGPLPHRCSPRFWQKNQLSFAILILGLYSFVKIFFF